MDKINNYRKIITNILTELKNTGSSSGQIDEYAICDEKTDNYILFNVGWYSNGFHQMGYPIHIRIKDEKVWVEWDGTDQEIVQQLIDAGISEDDIVLGWNKPQDILKAA